MRVNITLKYDELCQALNDYANQRAPSPDPDRVARVKAVSYDSEKREFNLEILYDTRELVVPGLTPEKEAT